MAWSHGIRWSDDMVGHLLTAAGEEIGRMPTANELTQAGMGKLANRVSRDHGFRWWATKLNLALKGTETHFGQTWEEHELEHFEAAGCVVERQTCKAPFDLLVSGHRVDVKAGRWREYGPSRAFFFSGIKRCKDCDFLDLVCIKDGKVAHRFVIPAASAPVHTISITAKQLRGDGKYSPFMGAEEQLLH